MISKIKYKYVENYKGETYKYSISVEKNVGYGWDVVVKEKTPGMASLDTKVLCIEDNGNSIRIMDDDAEFELNYCQEMYLLAALSARAKSRGCTTKLIEKIKKDKPNVGEVFGQGCY